MFQARFVKVDEFSWWYMEIIQTDAGMQFTSKELRLVLLAPDYQEINVEVEVTCQKYLTIAPLIWCTRRFMTSIYMFY